MLWLFVQHRPRMMLEHIKITWLITFDNFLANKFKSVRTKLSRAFYLKGRLFEKHAWQFNSLSLKRKKMYISTNIILIEFSNRRSCARHNRSDRFWETKFSTSSFWLIVSWVRCRHHDCRVLNATSWRSQMPYLFRIDLFALPEQSKKWNKMWDISHQVHSHFINQSCHCDSKEQDFDQNDNFIWMLVSKKKSDWGGDTQGVHPFKALIR